MPYEYPQKLTEHASEDSKRLWDCLWRVVEKLNLAEDVIARLEQEMQQIKTQKTDK